MIRENLDKARGVVNVSTHFSVAVLAAPIQDLLGAWASRTGIRWQLPRGSERAPIYRSPFPPATILSFTRPSLPSIMSAEPSTSTSHSGFVSIFNAALETYRHKTKHDLVSHPLLPNLQACDSPEAVLSVLREQIPAFSESKNSDDGLTKWVIPTVNVVYAFLDTLGQGVGLVNINVFLREESLL